LLFHVVVGTFRALHGDGWRVVVTPIHGWRLGTVLLATMLTATAAADVELSGLDKRQAANVRAHLGLEQIDCEAPSWLVSRRFRDVDTDVAEALEALGYYEFDVDKTLAFPDGECWQARVAVTVGQPVLVRSITIDVDGALGREPETAAVIGLAEGMRDQRFEHNDYEGIKRDLVDTARALGYFDAALVTHEVKVNVGERSADVTIRMTGGERYRFGGVTATEGILERRLIDVYVPFRSGDPFRADQVAQLRRNLNESGYFDQAIVIAEPSPAIAHEVPVTIELTPPRRHWVYTLGLGYATDTGVRFRADTDNRLLNDRGHRVEVRSLASKVRSDIDATYRIPHRNPLNDWLAFGGGLAHEETDTQTSDIRKVTARHVYDRAGWVEIDFSELTFEDFEIAGENGQSRLVLFGTTLSRVWRDDPVRPERGLRLSGTVQGATQDLGSDTDFVQARAAVKVVQKITRRNRLLARIESGWTWKDEFSDLPPSIRFFAGGDNSVRGYGYQDLGPEQDGEVVGGSGLLTGSVEWDWLFLPKWSLAAFVDSGSAYDREPTFSTGVGLGVRWYSPLGPIRVDLARPLDDPSRELRLHVSIGPDL